MQAALLAGRAPRAPQLPLTFEIDPTGFPLVWVEAIGAWMHWLPVSKLQFERFLRQAPDYPFQPAWYDHLLALNPLSVNPMDDASSGVYVKQASVSPQAASLEITTKLRNGGGGFASSPSSTMLARRGLGAGKTSRMTSSSSSPKQKTAAALVIDHDITDGTRPRRLVGAAMALPRRYG